MFPNVFPMVRYRLVIFADDSGNTRKKTECSFLWVEPMTMRYQVHVVFSVLANKISLYILFLCCSTFEFMLSFFFNWKVSQSCSLQGIFKACLWLPGQEKSSSTRVCLYSHKGNLSNWRGRLISWFSIRRIWLKISYTLSFNVVPWNEHVPIAIVFVALFHQYFFRPTSVILYQYCSAKIVFVIWMIIFVFGRITII